MRQLLIAAMLALAAPALAQMPGVYAVQGTNPDGSRYDGLVELAPAPNNTWRVTWRVEGNTVRGAGIVNGDVLAVAYVDGTEPGVVAWRILPDGRLDGPWSVGGMVGREVLTRR